MNILFYRYGSICEPSVLEAFRKLELDVTEETSEITSKEIGPGECARKVSDYLSRKSYRFVFSINYYPAISEVCKHFGIPYLCWVVDCPVLELYSGTIKNDTNRIFLFDKMMYEEFHAENPSCIFYLPLAVDTNHSNLACLSAGRSDIEKFTSDISFVGSLYKEKSPLDALKLSDFNEGYINAIIDAQLRFYGVNLIREALTPERAAAIRSEIPDFYQFPADARRDDVAILSDWYIGMKAAVVERKRLLNLLSERLFGQFTVDLYTGSDSSDLPKVHNKGRVQTLTEMPIVFRNSKINLNITIRPIRSGLSLRIWDILGAGGFLLTNFQTELEDYFKMGEDLETFSSEEELIDKAVYYLEHDASRAQIAQNGYQKVRKYHSFDQRVGDMLRVALP